jgi:hypothetical protein
MGATVFSRIPCCGYNQQATRETRSSSKFSVELNGALQVAASLADPSAETVISWLYLHLSPGGVIAMSASPTFPGKMCQYKPSSTCYPVHMTDFLNWASTEASFASTARSLARTRLSRARSSSSRCKNFRATSPSEVALIRRSHKCKFMKVREWQCTMTATPRTVCYS